MLRQKCLLSPVAFGSLLRCSIHELRRSMVLPCRHCSYCCFVTSSPTPASHRGASPLTAIGTHTHRAERIKNVSQPEPSDQINLRVIGNFPGAFWLICVICVAYYVAVYPFVSLGLVFFERKCVYVPTVLCLLATKRLCHFAKSSMDNCSPKYWWWGEFLNRPPYAPFNHVDNHQISGNGCWQ